MQVRASLSSCSCSHHAVVMMNANAICEKTIKRIKNTHSRTHTHTWIHWRSLCSSSSAPSPSLSSFSCLSPPLIIRHDDRRCIVDLPAVTPSETRMTAAFNQLNEILLFTETIIKRTDNGRSHLPDRHTKDGVAHCRHTRREAGNSGGSALVLVSSYRLCSGAADGAQQQDE